MNIFNHAEMATAIRNYNPSLSDFADHVDADGLLPENEQRCWDGLVNDLLPGNAFENDRLEVETCFLSLENDVWRQYVKSCEANSATPLTDTLSNSSYWTGAGW